MISTLKLTEHACFEESSPPFMLSCNFWILLPPQSIHLERPCVQATMGLTDHTPSTAILER